MPPSRKPSYIFYRYLTGWISLWLLVTNVTGLAYAEEADPRVEGVEIALTHASGAEDSTAAEVPEDAESPLSMIAGATVPWSQSLAPQPAPRSEPTGDVGHHDPAPLARADLESMNQPPASTTAPPQDRSQAVATPVLAQALPSPISAEHSGQPVVWAAGHPYLTNTLPNAPAGYPTGALVAVPGGALPSYSVGAPSSNDPFPAMGGSAGGVPVPWAMAQGATVPGMPGMPMGSPGYPGMPMGGGMWMMVWVPYGAPMPGMPIPGAPMPGMPIPGAPMPYGMVGYVPMMPYGAMPGMPLPGAPMPGGGAPNPYAYGGYGVNTAMPPGMAVQPYAQIEPPPMSTPLAVPSLPRLPSSGSPTLLLPPSSSSPAGPGGGFTSAQAPFPGTGTVPPATNPFSSPAPFSSPTPPPVRPVETMAVATPLEDFNQPITETSLTLQGLYVLQGDQSSARARLSGNTFLTPNLLVGGALDLVTGPDLTNSDGVQLTELYVATAVPGVPGLRFRLGQLDITSYFDRNSFAKDVGRDFFNSTFHTNPALIAGANATASSPGGLVQWSLNDNLILSASAFSSAGNITDFALDGFAGEVGLRTGDLILRGTFLTGRDTDFQGTGDRLDAYGVNAEWFLTQANIGLFGRYGQLNSSGGFSGRNYSLGLNAFDVFMDDDRLGLAYGRNLPSASVDGLKPDVLELFYDFEALPNVRMGFTFQQRNELRESFAGFRIRGGLDLLPTPTLR